MSRALSEALDADVSIVAKSLNRGSCACSASTPEPNVKRVPELGAFGRLPKQTPWATLRTLLMVMGDWSSDWPLRAWKLSRSVYRRGEVECVAVTTGPPWIVVVAAFEAKRLRVPLIVDLQDSPNRYGNLPGWIIRLKRIHRLLVKSATRTACLISVVNASEQRLVESWLGRRVVVFQAGPDLSQWSDVKRSPRVTDAPSFLINYSGNVYDTLEIGAVAAVLQRCSEGFDENELKFTLAGPDLSRRAWTEQFGRHGVRLPIVYLGMLPFSESAETLPSSDLLLLPGQIGGPSYGPGAKIFDYLASGSPVLYFPANCPESAALVASQGESCCATSDPAVAETWMRGLFDAWKSNHVVRRPVGEIAGSGWRSYAESAHQYAVTVKSTVDGL